MYGSVDVCLRDVNGWDIGFALSLDFGCVRTILHFVLWNHCF
jgi:hypothetical protein